MSVRPIVCHLALYAQAQTVQFSLLRPYEEVKAKKGIKRSNQTTEQQNLPTQKDCLQFGAFGLGMAMSSSGSTPAISGGVAGKRAKVAKNAKHLVN